MEKNRDSCLVISINIGTAAEAKPVNGVNLASGSLDNQEKRAASEISGLETSIEDDALDSDGESSESIGINSLKVPSFGTGLTRLLQGDNVYNEIKRSFVQGCRFLQAIPEVVSIHRNSFPGPIGQAKLQAFQMLAKANEKRRGMDEGTNVKHAWYRATVEEIHRILQYGFCHSNVTNGPHGCGIYLSPDESPTESVRRIVADKDGIHHLLRCRVILGNLEIVQSGSNQCLPSSEHFDSGIGLCPSRYVVWSTHMNSHILPEYVVSFCPPSRLKDSLKKPKSPWMPFPALLSWLSKSLPPRDMALITKYYRDHKAKKISRIELIKQLRRIAGDELLVAVIKSFGGKAGVVCSPSGETWPARRRWDGAQMNKKTQQSNSIF